MLRNNHYFLCLQVSCLWQGNYLLSVALSGCITYLDVNNPSKPIRVIRVSSDIAFNIKHLMHSIVKVEIVLFQGHNKPITVLDLSVDRKTIYTGSHDGIVTSWNSESGRFKIELQRKFRISLNVAHLIGENDRVQGNGHGNQINGMKASAERVFTCGIDDKLREFDVQENAYSAFEKKLGSQPRGMDINGDTVAVATVREVRHLRIKVLIC